MAEDVVVEACKLLKPIKFKEIHNRLENRFEEGDDNPMLKMGTTLFELYLGLQRFAMCVSIFSLSLSRFSIPSIFFFPNFSLGTGLCPTGSSFKINEFHLWFHRGVAQWLDIALYKAMQRIEKAAELDNLKPVDSSVKYSSSAVDTLAIFYQVILTISVIIIIIFQMFKIDF